MKVHIKRAFGSSSDTYDSSCDIQRIVADNLINHIKVDNTEKILEIGTGTGIFTNLIKEKFPDSSVFCLDIAHSLLKKAQKKMPDNFYICGDGENLPVLGGFDIVVSSSSLQWFQNLSESLPKLAETANKFAFSVFVEGTFAEMSVINSMTGFGSVYPLPQYEKIIKSLSHFEIQYEVKDYVIYYDSVQEFLKKQKGTGATFSGSDKIASKSSYKKFLELYPMLFGENGKIPVTCRILYVTGSSG